MVKQLGADEAIDYRTVEPSLPGYLKDTFRGKPFDAIVDCVGAQDLYRASPAYLKLNGKVICVRAMTGIWAHGKNFLRNSFLPAFLGGTPRKWMFFNVKPDTKTIQQLKKYADDGKLRFLVDSAYKMEDALEVCSSVACAISQNDSPYNTSLMALEHRWGPAADCDAGIQQA